MKQLDKMYDIIFEDERLQELFLNFHTDNWCLLDKDEKFLIIEEINSIVADLYGYEKNNISKTESNFYGFHSSFKWEITISEESLEYDNGYEIIDTYFHELRHAFQSRALEDKLTPLESVDEDLLDKWNRNFAPGNYISNSPAYYMWQYVERDAWTTGMLFAYRIYKMNREKLKKPDEEWKNYCRAHQDTINYFISENEKASQYIAKKDKEIEEIFKENLVDMEQYKKAKLHVDKILGEKKVEEMSLEEVGLLLSKYCYYYMDISTKVKVINRYYDLLKVSDFPYPIKENTVGSIKMGEYVVGVDSSLSCVNNVLSVIFQEITKGICSDAEYDYPLTEKQRNEVKLNMFEDDKGNKINYVSDSDNLFLFSLQPYARYESEYILKEFRRLKKIEYDYFKKNSNQWEYWENFYSNKLIFKTASKLMDVKFEDYYKALLEKYRSNISEYFKSKSKKISKSK